MNLISLKTELRQELKLTPQLLQSMEVLQMNSQELLDYLGKISEENPTLELSEASELRSAYAELRQKASWLDAGTFGTSFAHEEDGPPEPGATDKELDSLSAFLCDQLERKRLPKPMLALCKYMAELVDEVGYLTQEDLDELTKLFADQANYISSREDRINETENMVTDHTTPEKKTLRQNGREAWSYFYRKMVDAGHSVTKFAKATGDQYLYQFYNQARAASSAGVSMITDAQTNINAQKVGKSLNEIFSPIREKGEEYYRAFQMYLFHLHNIDRMSLSKNKEGAVLEAKAALHDFDSNHQEIRTDTEAQLMRLTESMDPDVAALATERMRLLRNLNAAEAIKDKPVFSNEVTADESRERARRALQQNPEFDQYRQEVRTYIDNLMQYRVDSGLMTQENADYLKKLYPNYVPTMRVGTQEAGAGRDRNAVRIGKTVGRAEGGTENLVPLHEALGRQTMKVVREGSKNRFGQRLLDDYIRAGDTAETNRYVQEANEYEHEFSPDTLDDMSREQLTKDKILTVYKDGKLWELTVDDTMFDALKALSPDAEESNMVTRTIRAANNLFKSLVTGYNPTFTVRNTVRDLQTAGLYTRDAAAFARNYPKALAEIKNNGEYWKMYKALGGSFSSVFDYNTGTVKEPKGRTAKLMAKVEALNMAMEQAPRLAEFMGVVEKGGTGTENLADALYAAADENRYCRVLQGHRPDGDHRAGPTV